MSDPRPSVDDAIDRPVAIQHLGFKAGLLLATLALLVLAAVLYLLHARGVFEATQRLVLVADNSEGVVVGMDLTFSGFPIGRVRSVDLGDDGKAHINVDVPTKDARWLKESSVFTLVRGLVGGTNLRAFTGILTDTPLQDGAVRHVLHGDSTEEIPKLVAATKDLVTSLNTLVGSDSALSRTLANLEAATQKLNGQRGALGVLFGNERDAQRIVTVMERTNALLARLDGMAVKADTQVFGSGGMVPEVRDTIAQLKALLGATSTSLKKVDAILDDAQAISGSARNATVDLAALRTEVEANLRKIELMINEINRKWPFAREVEIKLP
jgi:phospholipid/cholesterol/gamma-HCH transport system substrate-binding protein